MKRKRKQLNVMNNASVIEMWKSYKKKNPEAPEDYVAWAFGDSKEMADELAELVLERKQPQHPTMCYMSWRMNPYPVLGYITSYRQGQAVAILETISVEVVPFDEVTEEHAYLEGEGDRSLDYWREVHETFFKKEFEDIEQDFHYKIPLACESFELVYKR